MKRLDKELGLKDANVEKTTIARANAISDIRNLASFAAANHLMVPITNFNLIINVDATQCKTSGESTQKVEVKVKKGRNTNHDPLKVLPGENESLTSLFIKYYMVFSAGGSLAPPIFIVADDNMASEEIYVKEIPGLGIGTDVSHNGYLVFCKTRSLSSKFYTWMLQSIILPYVQQIRLKKNLDDDSTCWFTLDGESKQILPMMTNECQQLFSDNSIVVTKPPGSSHVTQPADVGNEFKSIKTALSKMKNCDNKQ